MTIGAAHVLLAEVCRRLAPCPACGGVGEVDRSEMVEDVVTPDQAIDYQALYLLGQVVRYETMITETCQTCRGSGTTVDLAAVAEAVR
jgi:hypothetical protein